MNAASFFSKKEQEEILSAVREAEKDTSGEIRVHIETRLRGDVLDRSAWLFGKLNMHKTENRNGVLFYLAVESRQFAIIGDAGINMKVPPGFWDEVKEMMQNEFVKGNFTAGLSNGIKLAGEKLREHFPYKKDDVNELPDDLSFGNPDTSESK